MSYRKLLLVTLLTITAWFSTMAQSANVHGTVTSTEGDPQSNVSILVSVFFADSTAALYTELTDTNGYYSVDIPTQDPSILGFVDVSMVDCWGTTESQYFTILNGNEVFVADFIYCQEILMDSCTVFILEEWNPNWVLQLTAWTPPGFNASYLWSTGETSETITPQTSGYYSVVATFPWGCEAADSVFVNIDSIGSCFSYIVSTMNPDSSTYDLEVIANGIAPFSYLWSTGDTTSTLEDVIPGTYCVEVTDATGCQYSTCIIVEGFNFCEVYVYEDPAIGGLVAQGYGQSPIHYVWDTGDSTQVIYPDAPGVYCVTMYDNSGCITSSCYEYGWTQDSCYVYVGAFESDSNTLALQAFGYTSAESWSFIWSTGETTEIIYPLDPAQSYCVTMTDSEGCVSSGCYDPGNYCYAWVDVQYIDTTSATITVYTDPIFNIPGSTPPEYLWSNGSTTPEITVTESGEYCVTVTIGAGCITESCVYVDFENLGNECSAWVFTYPDSSGQWYAEAYAWGVGTFTYQWTNGDTNAVTQLGFPNEYACVTVTSSFGCESVACVDSLYLPCEAVISVNYISNSTAILTATVWNEPSQGSTFEWSTGETGPVITVNAEGTYCVVVMSGGCVSTTCVDVFFWSVDSCGVWISEDNSSGAGVLYTANAWGTAPFQYLWSNGQTTDTTFVDFGIHDLCVTVTDATGCISSGCNYQVDSCYISLEYSSQPVPSIQVVSQEPIAWVTWSTGDSLPWLIITEPGTYCATVTTIFGCEASACITIDSIPPGEGQNVISGYVFGDTLVALEGYVNAYLFDPNSGEDFEFVDSAVIGQSGFYSFSGLPNGVYIVKAVLTPGSSGADDYIPTYHYSSSTWETADLIALPDWLPVTKDISLIPTTGLNGGGVIGGFVTDPNHLVAGQAEESRELTGLANVEVLLRNAQGQPLQYAWSMVDGGFRFTGLPWGTYRISYDIPGLTSPDIWVTLTPEDPERLQVTLVVNQGTVAVNEPVAEVIKLYPNPAKHEINIPVPALNTTFDLVIMDMQGKVVYAGSARNSNGVITVGVGSFAPGLYHINLTGDQGLFYGRFIKQD